MKFKKFINTDLTEAYTPEYEAQMVQIFNKAVRDELEASISYKIMAEQIQGPGINEIREELEEHAKEEFQHFQEFIAFAASHSMLNQIKFEIRTDYVNPSTLPTDVSGIVQFTQDLETEAYNDYKRAAMLAKENLDPETKMFFIEKMKDEMRHFDDISALDKTKRTRKIGE